MNSLGATSLSAASRDHVQDSDKQPLTRADREPAATGVPIVTRFMYFFTVRNWGLDSIEPPQSTLVVPAAAVIPARARFPGMICVIPTYESQYYCNN